MEETPFELSRRETLIVVAGLMVGLSLAALDGTIVALDRANGKIVWRHKAPGGINGWMSVVGDHLYVPVGNGSPPALLDLGLS